MLQLRFIDSRQSRFQKGTFKPKRKNFCSIGKSNNYEINDIMAWNDRVCRKIDINLSYICKTLLECEHNSSLQILWSIP